MIYSKRIKKIASIVDSGVNVVDIGCDHGLLDIYLTLNNNNKCIAADINQNSLNSAISNIKKMNLNIETILSNGFENIEVKKNSTCIIAGMGTNTIISILNNSKRELVDTFIIQTNNDYYNLRKQMINYGYYIDEEIVFEDKKIWYVIIKFKKGKVKYKKNELELGPVLINKNDEETNKYFETLFNKYNKLLELIPRKHIIKRIKLKILIRYIKNVGPAS